LIGFVNAWCDRRGGFRGYYERASYEALTASLHQQLSADVIESLASVGALLTYQEAIDEALNLSFGSEPDETLELRPAAVEPAPRQRQGQEGDHIESILMFGGVGYVNDLKADEDEDQHCNGGVA
jgi:hypothetical protein